MKTINVVAAIIIKDDKIYTAQRGYGEFKGGWEFPGGKKEDGETDEEALIREIQEELDVSIEVGELFDEILYKYDTFILHMNCYLCKIVEGTLVLNEHTDSRWLDSSELDSVNWLLADIDVVKKLKNKSFK